MDEDDLKVLLLEADADPVGVAVRTNDPLALRQRVYPLMKKLGLRLSTRPVGDELWLYKKSA